MESAVPAVMTALIMPKDSCSVAELQLTDERAVPRFGTDSAAPAGLNAVLCKVLWAALQPVDGMIMQAAHPPQVFQKQLPHVLGIDFAGTVAETPPGTDTGFSVGDRVCGFTGACKPGGGTLAQYCSVPADCIAKVPDSMPLADAATVPCCALTAAAGLWRHLKLDREHADRNAGTTMLIYGASTCVGQYAAQLAKLAGVSAFLHGYAHAHVHWCAPVPPHRL